MKPKFKNHYGDKLKFLGHFFEHDVYIGMESVSARYGDEDHEYASCPLVVLRGSITDGGRIGDGKSWSMPYIDWLFSEKRIPSTSAMILGLTLHGINMELKNENAPRKS